jgi:hypothetical protein
MDMKVYVSCYIPSIKQTVMRIIYIHSQSTVLEARDQILQALGLGEKKVLLSLRLEREEFLFSGTQVYIEALHTHIDILHLLPQYRLEPCYTLQEEFIRHEHRSPKVGDIFKLRLMLPKFNEDVQDENGLDALEALQGRKRNLEEENCEVVMKKAKLLPTSMASSIISLHEHFKTSYPPSRLEWMGFNHPVADVAVGALVDNRFATNDCCFAYVRHLQCKKLQQMISQLLVDRYEQSVVEGIQAYGSIKSPNSLRQTVDNILIVGPIDIGKSHLLAAAV